MIADTPNLNRHLYDYSTPVDITAFTGEHLFHELINTRAFKRMRSIRFLGAIDYLLVRVPNGARGNLRHTRFQHSLGVARLALLFAGQRDLSPADRRLLYVAALLHDVGHAPLSHSLEPVFSEIYGLEHHRATEHIITGKAQIGKEVYDVLKRHAVDIERVLAIVAGATSCFEDFFAGPITFDTIEGILRSWTYAKGNGGVPSPETITEAAMRRANDADRNSVDEFWSYKDKVYRHIINSRLGVLADYACQIFLRRNVAKIQLDDYFLTEEQMFRKLPGLKPLLTSKSFEIGIMRQVQQPIRYKARRFYVNQNHDFFARNDWARYVQTKEDRFLVPADLRLPAVPQELMQDLFDDDAIRTQ